MLSGLSDAPTLQARCGCQAATEQRINIAHLVLHPIWKDELGSEKVTQKGQTQSTMVEDARTKCVRQYVEIKVLWNFSSVKPCVSTSVKHA